MNVSLNQQMQRAARLSGSRPAVFDRSGQWSWAQVADRVARLGGVLRQLGVERGDRVAVLASNSVDYLALYYAIPWIGAISLPVNSRLNQHEIEFWLRDSGARVMVVDADFHDVSLTLLETVDTLEKVVSLADGAPAPIETLATQLAVASAVEPVACRGEDVATIFYTGGTTGASKGVTLTHAGLVFASLQWAQTMWVTTDDRVLIAIPMFHLAAGLNALACAVLACDVVIEPRFLPAETLAVIERQRISKCVFVPAVLDMLISAPEFESTDVSSLKKISYGGAPMPLPVLERALTKLPNTGFFQIYGQTESGGVATCLTPRYHQLSGPDSEKRVTAGRPIAGLDLRICDPDGHDMPLGEAGEICLRSPSLTPGYWNAPGKTAELYHGDWLRTGDVGVLDEDGFLTVVDRIKDMIISGGENVFAGEVEAALYTFDGIDECAVIGVPDVKWGERVHAVVRLKPGVSEDAQAVMDHCRERVAHYKAVRSVEFVSEPLPRSPMNKVLKRVLRERSAS